MRADISRVFCVVCCVKRAECAKRGTYQDEAADRYEVPENILLPLEFGVPGLDLAEILVDEVGIQDDAQLGTTQQKGGEEPPNLRWHMEDGQRGVEE